MLSSTRHLELANQPWNFGIEISKPQSHATVVTYLTLNNGYDVDNGYNGKLLCSTVFER
jgi:hypothetical protein